MDYSENNKRIVKNTLFLYFRMLLTMGVGLYTSRVILLALGIEDFGIYNIVGGVVVLFSFLSNAMSMATQRFLTFELGKNNIEQVRRIFSMSITVYISIIFFIIILAETVGLWVLNTQINIPYGKIDDANWVYQFSVLIICIGIIQTPYNASIVAYERMSFYAYASIVDVICRLAVAVILVYIGFNKLKAFSVLMCIVAVISFCLYRYYCKRKFEICRYRFFFDLGLYKKLMSFSGWSLFGSAAIMSANQGISILLNLFYGVIVNAAMGIAVQVSHAVNQFVGNFQTAFRPQIIKLYATGDNRNLEQLIFRTSKMSFFILFVLTLPIILNIDFVLKVWLKTVPEYAATFCILVLVSSLLETLSTPLWMTVQAVGKIKQYQLCFSAALSLNIILSYIFLRIGFQPSIVFFIQIFVNVICLIIRLFFIRAYINMSILQFMRKVTGRILPVIVLTIPIPFILSRFYTEWQGLILTSFSFLVLGFVAIYYIGLTKHERKNISVIIINKLKCKQ